MANTRETMGEQACLDALVANTLTSFEDDGVTKVGANCLSYHTALTDVTLSQCKSVGSTGLTGCTALTTVDMQGTGFIGAGAFNGDSALAHLILRGGSMTTLASTSAFTGTPISLNNGAVYVPQDQLATYKADNNWKNYLITTLDKYPLSDFSTIEDSWSTIISKAEDGTAAESYSIGDTKLLDLGSEGKVYMQIVGFGVDPLASDSTNFAGITFVAKNLLTTNHRMTASYSNGLIWGDSEMRTYLNNDILPLLPSVLQQSIKEVVKYSNGRDSSGNSITDQTSNDALWIPSGHEIGLGARETQGPVYDSLKTTAGRTKSKQDGAIGEWVLRTVESSSAFTLISVSGSVMSGGANAGSARGVCIGFCI